MQRAAKESKEELEHALRGADLVVVTVRLSLKLFCFTGNLVTMAC